MTSTVRERLDALGRKITNFERRHPKHAARAAELRRSIAHFTLDIDGRVVGLMLPDDYRIDVLFPGERMQIVYSPRGPGETLGLAFDDMCRTIRWRIANVVGGVRR